MGDRGLVHLDVVVIIEIDEPFPRELGAVVGDDEVWDPEAEYNVMDEA
jgi:hypothetical protein